MTADPIAQAHREALALSQPGKQTYTVEMSYADITALRDAIDLAVAYIKLRRTLDLFWGNPVRKGPGPLRKRLTALQKAWPQFKRVEIDLAQAASLGWEFISDGTSYAIHVVDERPDMDLDPTLNVFRGDEEEPIATIHLNPEAPCYDHHVIARALPLDTPGDWKHADFCPTPSGHNGDCWAENNRVLGIEPGPAITIVEA